MATDRYHVKLLIRSNPQFFIIAYVLETCFTDSINSIFKIIILKSISFNMVLL